MKILILTDYFYPHVGGGVEKVIMELSLRLVRTGNQVCILTLSTNAKNEEVFQGIHIIRVNAFDLTKITGFQSAISLRMWKIGKDLINEFKPDIIHLHNRFFFSTLIGILLKKGTNIPLITTLHLGSIDYIKGVKGFFIKKIEKYMIRKINQYSKIVTAVSNNVKENGIKLGISSKKCVVIPNGVDLQFFSMEYSDNEKPRNVVFIGRLLTNKGPQILLQSAKLIIKKIPDIQLNIVGDGPQRANLEKFVKSNNLSNNVKLLGKLDDIRSIMKKSDLYVRPSLLDGMPLGVLEAMAAKLPIIATNIAGTSELIETGKTGHLVTANDAKDLSDAIFTLLEDKNYMKKIANNGYELVRSKYDWNNISPLYEECYRKILELK